MIPLDTTWTASAILLAGVADGFNPCAFSIAIVLAGVLAAGGRRGRARLVGGLVFCASSFFTYFAMGLGLLQVLRALAGFQFVQRAFLTLLSFVLFSLAFLSVRDAFRYRRERTPAAIALQLPDRVKRAIRSVAEACWRGSAIVWTSAACGFVVTLLDSLCTGQVYLPVLALVSREREVPRLVGLLALYNLAFILPLVAVFTLAAAGARSERLSVWSKRNVFPSKLVLGFLFALLGALVFPRFGGMFARFLG